LQILLITEEVKPLVFEIIQKLSSEFTGQDLSRDKKLLAGIDPATEIRQAARRDDTVDMRMETEALPPSVQYRGKAKRCAKILFVGGKFLQGFSHNPEQQTVEFSLILIDNRTQNIRHGKDDMEVADIQQIILLIVNPAFFGKRLALWTVTVPAGVVGDFDAAAAFAGVQMCTQLCGSAFLHSGQGF